jgi:hypothetical protein
MNVSHAVALIDQMTDLEVSDRVFGGEYWWLIAALLRGRRTPPDLAGRKSRYTIPCTRPWWPAREVTRERRLRAVLSAHTARGT